MLKCHKKFDDKDKESKSKKTKRKSFVKSKKQNLKNKQFVAVCVAFWPWILNLK